jgi:hypothetical protein
MDIYFLANFVPWGRVELPRFFQPLAPKASASTSFATTAGLFDFNHRLLVSLPSQHALGQFNLKSSELP